jgi:hypothetical protein
MSYSVVQPGAKKRPAVVSAATALLYVSAALLLIQAVLAFLQVGPIRRVVNDFYADRPEEQAAASAGFLIGIIATGVVFVLIAVALVVLGRFVGKGKQPARIITWVLAGLGVLCLGCGVAAGAISSSLGSSLGSTPDSEALTQAMADVVPEWQNTVGTVLQILSLIILVVVIVLLALPAANDFFRKEQEVWVPPTAWPGDPSGGVPPYQPPGPGTPPPPYNPPPPPPVGQ